MTHSRRELHVDRRQGASSRLQLVGTLGAHATGGTPVARGFLYLGRKGDEPLTKSLVVVAESGRSQPLILPMPTNVINIRQFIKILAQAGPLAACVVLSPSAPSIRVTTKATHERIDARCMLQHRLHVRAG